MKGAFENLARNWSLSLPTILVITLILTMIQGLVVMHERAENLLSQIEQKFSITVYFKDDADAFAIGTLITELESRSDVVKPVQYTSKDDAWKILSTSFGLNTDLFQNYRIALPASMTVTLRSAQDSEAVEAFIQTRGSTLLKDPRSGQDAQKKLTQTMAAFVSDFESKTVQAALLFIIFFSIGGALLITSTIHLAISNRHREITIMKLMGTPYTAITMPFVTEGFIIAALAFVLHLIIVALSPLGGEFSALQLNALLIAGLLTIILGVGLSYLTARFYIKKKAIFS